MIRRAAALAVFAIGCAGAPPEPIAAPPPSSSSSPAEAPSDGRVKAFCRVLPCKERLVSRRILERDERFGDVVCKAKMEASIDRDGKVVACKLAQPMTVDGLQLAADTFVKFDDEGHVEDMELKAPRDFTLADGTAVKCAADDASFRKQRLMECKLAAALTKNGVHCRAGAGVSFYESGAISGATVDAPVATKELTFPAGSRIYWKESGAVAGGYLEAPLTARGLSIKYDVELHDDGALATIELEKDATIQGHGFPALAKIGFRADGSLEAARYVEKMGTMIHGELWTDTRTMTFDAKGNVTSSNLEHYQARDGPEPP